MPVCSFLSVGYCCSPSPSATHLWTEHCDAFVSSSAWYSGGGPRGSLSLGFRDLCQSLWRMLKYCLEVRRDLFVPSSS
jgi:hypothetical protein